MKVSSRDLNFDKECLRHVNARVFTNQMWTDGQRTKTDTKTSPEQSDELKSFHDDWTNNVTSRGKCAIPPPPGSHVFQRTGTIFKLNSLFIRKTAPPTGGHVFQRTGTTFELNQHIIKTNILTNDLFLNKFREDRTRNVASRVVTNKCGRTNGRTDDGQRPITKAHLSNQVS
ncbi:hypothetical protein DPMN_109501 [Dreissena polymorpha]|uniref:Uncharacterized protein n=1 Tax=Dreissena polymorpha TaxID=45954 RepID=A0A9D4QM11_DREPO|nr:hypothetical protein DPMN_109501 [Dreissena polymorpha]